jgi:hypothetical protein
MMARIRTIKPEFWSSEQIVECSTSARLLFIGLWNFCDDGGVHPASLMRLKMEVFPADPFTSTQMGEWITELVDQGLVEQYKAQGKEWWWVTGFRGHQRIDKPTLRYPRPFDEASRNTRRGVDEASPPEPEPEPERTCKGTGTGPVSSEKTSTSGWGDVTTRHLQDDSKLAALWLRAVRVGVIQESEANELAFWATACHCLREGKKPVAMFVSAIKAGRWGVVSNGDEDEARARLRELRGKR